LQELSGLRVGAEQMLICRFGIEIIAFVRGV